jgi:hypothetical protein
MGGSVMPARIVIVVLAIVALPFVIVGQSPTSKAEPSSTVPPECDKPELLAKGRPIMIPWRNGFSLGVSLAKQEFKADEPIAMHIWIDNPGDTPAAVLTCEDLDFFKANDFGLFGSDGHKLLSHEESRMQAECRAKPGSEMGGWVCASNVLFEVPSRTCINTDDEYIRHYDFTIVLTRKYNLTPGDYAVRPLRPSDLAEDMCKPDYKRPLPVSSGAKLTFSVK